MHSNARSITAANERGAVSSFHLHSYAHIVHQKLFFNKINLRSLLFLQNEHAVTPAISFVP